MKRITLIAAGAFVLQACGGEQASTESAESYSSAGSEYAADATERMENQANFDIVETAIQAGNFNTLATALTEAGMVDTLKGEGPFTVFAPTDDAFAALPAGTLENLLKPENREQLRAVLAYHVVSGDVRAEDVVELTEAPTLHGAHINIEAGNGVRINDATVTQADIACSNGVIHVIDKVLLPPQ